jgi:Domain of unknown function (DUF929)
LIGVVVSGLLFGSVAVAVAAPSPRAALLQAQSRVHALATQASLSSVADEAAAAVTALARATLPGLWINSREADAPPYGARVFDESATALRDLQRLSAGSVRDRGAAIKLIVAADRGLAERAIREARGGSGTLLLAAKRALAAGSREAGAGRGSSAVQSYKKAWESAYGALTELVAAEATSMPSTVLTAAAEQALTASKFGMAGPRIVQGSTPLTAAGKPEVFFAGSEGCPFCGVQRWGMIVALSQFGTFSNLHLMQSIPTEPPADRTFTFLGSSYQSPYVSFAPVEVWSNVPKGFGFARLQPLTPSEQGLLRRFDPPGQTPFIDVANRFISINSTVDPSLIAGRSWTQLAGSLTDPSSISTQAIAGEAEVLSAQLCEATGGNPQSVCSSAVVQQYEAALPSLNGQGGACPAPPPADDTATRAKHSSRRGANPVATAARHCGV